MSGGETTNKPSKLPTLEYLPASRQTPKHEQQKNLDAIIETKKRYGYLEEPSHRKSMSQSSTIDAPMVSYYDEVNRTDSMWTKMQKIGKYNPFVPLGCLVTLGVLANGVWAMRKKDTAKSQRMMRYRIAAQGTTIIALVVGTMISQYLVTSSSRNSQSTSSSSSSESDK